MDYKKGNTRRRGGVKNWRVIFCFLSIFVLFGVFLLRAFYISTSINLKKEAKKQSTSYITLKGKRGNIYDANGNILATSQVAWSLWVDPMKDDDTKKMISMGIIKEEEIEKAKKEGRRFIWVKRLMFQKEKEEIEKKGIKTFIREWKRVYPYGEITSFLGFTDIDLVGIEGIEKYYDKELKGEEAKIIVLQDALGRQMTITPPYTPKSGKDIYLTIDINLQTILYENIKKVVVEENAKGGFGIAMDPFTGKILALVGIGSKFPYIRYVFEPGSTFKIFIIAAAIEEKIISTNDIFFCENGKWEYYGKVFKDVHPIGYATIKEIITHSSNICAAKILINMFKKFQEYLEKFGFGEKTKIDLPGEEIGLIKSRLYPIDIATQGFGQGIGVTGIQMLNAFSSVINGGLLMKPYIAQKIGDVEIKPMFLRKTISERTSKIMRELLRSVVIEGTGKKAEVLGYGAGGKTGTAQKVEGGKYTSKYWSSFIGFSPAENPKISLFILIDEPKGEYYGGAVAAPIFSETLSKFFPLKLVYMENKNKENDNNRENNNKNKNENNKGNKNKENKNNERENGENTKITLSEFLNSLSEEKKSKKIKVEGWGFVTKYEEKEDEIIIYLSQ